MRRRNIHSLLATTVFFVAHTGTAQVRTQGTAIVRVDGSAGPIAAQQSLDLAQMAPLESRGDVTAFFHEVTQRQVRLNTDRLVEIDEAYRAAVAELSAENVNRLNGLLDAQRAALAELRGLGLPAAEQRRRTQQIQAELDVARADLAAWFAAETDRTRGEHSSGRDTQRSLHNELLARIRAEQPRVIADIADGPVDVDAVLAALGLSQDARDRSPSMLPQRPPDPRPRLENANTAVPTAARAPLEPGKIDPTVEAKINTQVAPKQFELAVYAIESIVLTNAQVMDNALRGETLTLDLTIANVGNTEWNSNGTRVEIRLAQGYHDYSRTDQVHVLAGRAYYDAEGVYDFSIPVGTGLQLPILVKGRERAEGPIVPVPNPFPNFRRPWRLRQIAIRSGRGPVLIEPHVWQTVDVRLYPPEDQDQTLTDNGAFFHFKMKPDGSIVDRDEFVFYKPGPPRLADR